VDWRTVPTLGGSTTIAAEVQRLRRRNGDRFDWLSECRNTEWIAVPSQSCLSTVDVSNLVLTGRSRHIVPVIKTHRGR